MPWRERLSALPRIALPALHDDGLPAGEVQDSSDRVFWRAPTKAGGEQETRLSHKLARLLGEVRRHDHIADPVSPLVLRRAQLLVLTVVAL